MLWIGQLLSDAGMVVNLIEGGAGALFDPAR